MQATSVFITIYKTRNTVPLKQCSNASNCAYIQQSVIHKWDHIFLLAFSHSLYISCNALSWESQRPVSSSIYHYLPLTPTPPLPSGVEARRGLVKLGGNQGHPHPPQQGLDPGSAPARESKIHLIVINLEKYFCNGINSDTEGIVDKSSKL